MTVQLSQRPAAREVACNLTPSLLSATHTEIPMATPQPPHGFAVDVEVDADRSTVVVRGELDLSNATELSEALASAGTGVSCVVADLRAVTFIDSSAIGALVSSGRSLAEAGSRLQIGPRSPAVTQILELTGLAAGTEAFDVLEEGT